jgi:hypothetical protein
MGCHQQSRATSSEHHSERHSHKARYFRRALLLISTFILSSAAASSYAQSADETSLGGRQLLEKADASNIFLRKGSNSHTAAPKRISKSKLHSVDPAPTQRGKAVIFLRKGSNPHNAVPKRTSKSKLHSVDPAPTQRGKVVKGAKSGTAISKIVNSPVTEGALLLS